MASMNPAAAPPEAVVPPYWDEACKHLVKRDRVMKKLIPQFGEARLQSRGDAFATLARSIVGQQISVKAADSVWARFAGYAQTVSPAHIATLELDALAACGLSRRKAEYLRDLAGHFVDGRIEPARWKKMEDEAVIAELVDVRGIGRWTAEMFLMFALARPDVFSLGDLALRQGLSRLHPDTPSADVLARWAPYRTLAARYVWADNARVKGGGEPV